MYSGKLVPTFWINILPPPSALTQTLKMEAVCSSKMSVPIRQNTSIKSQGTVNHKNKSSSLPVYLIQLQGPLRPEEIIMIIAVTAQGSIL
jgi:hypothetical protein